MDYLNLTTEAFLHEIQHGDFDQAAAAASALSDWLAHDVDLGLNLSQRASDLLKARISSDGAEFAVLWLRALWVLFESRLESSALEDAADTLIIAVAGMEEFDVYEEIGDLMLRQSWLSLFQGRPQQAWLLSFGVRGFALDRQRPEWFAQSLIIEGFVYLKAETDQHSARACFEEALSIVDPKSRIALSAMNGLAQTAVDEEEVTEWLSRATQITDPRFDAVNARTYWLYGKQAIRCRRFHDGCGALFTTKLRLQSSPVDLCLVNLDLAAALLDASKPWTFAASMIAEADQALSELTDGLLVEEARSTLSALASVALTSQAIMSVRRDVAERARERGARKFNI